MDKHPEELCTGTCENSQNWQPKARFVEKLEGMTENRQSSNPFPFRKNSQRYSIPLQDYYSPTPSPPTTPVQNHSISKFDSLPSPVSFHCNSKRNQEVISPPTTSEISDPNELDEEEIKLAKRFSDLYQDAQTALSSTPKWNESYSLDSPPLRRFTGVAYELSERNLAIHNSGKRPSREESISSISSYFHQSPRKDDVIEEGSEESEEDFDDFEELDEEQSLERERALIEVVERSRESFGKAWWRE